MPITLAGPLGNHPGMNGSPRYKAPTPQMAPQEKSAADMIKEQASSMAMEAGAKAAQEAGTEYIVDPLKAKAKEMWTGFSAPATAPASSFMPSALPAELTGPMMSGSQTATADALLSSGMTGAEAMAGAGSLAPAAAAPVASTIAPAVTSTVAPAVAGTVAPAVAGAGPMAAMMASPLAPLAIGALAGKAFGLFDKGGKVEKNNIPVYANMGGLFKMTSPAAMLMDKNKKPEDLLKMVSPLAMLMNK